MASPTNSHLLTDFPTPSALLTQQQADSNLQVWALVTEYLVPKGTDIEQLVADLYDGKGADPAVASKLKGIYLAGFLEVAPVAGPLQQITNSTLTEMFPVELSTHVDADSELWNVTTQYLLVKGTDFQKMILDSLEGKFDKLDPKMSPDCKAIVPISDVSKIK